MTHHTWHHRFENALRNKNWKKILIHEIIEYSWLGGWITALEAKPESFAIGIAGAVIIHFVVFEAIDALHKKHENHSRHS